MSLINELFLGYWKILFINIIIYLNNFFFKVFILLYYYIINQNYYVQLLSNYIIFDAY